MSTKIEVYMLVKDRRRIARLIEIKGVSKSAVARAAGWRSHSYLHRLLTGEANSCRPEPALAIASFLEVNLEDIFLPKVSSNKQHSVKT